MLEKSENFGTAVSERRTSMRLCDLDEIKICVDRQYKNCHGYSMSKKAIYREAILAVKSILHSAKPIDAVEVVRCMECKFRSSWMMNRNLRYICPESGMFPNGENDFCSYGKRKEGAD